MSLMFRDFRPWVDDLVRAINAPDADEGFRQSAIALVVKLVRNDTLKSVAELVEWKSDLDHTEIAKLLRELAEGVRV